MRLPEQPLIARAGEYVFRLSPALVISGKVIDALTRQQVREFRVVPGGRIAGNQDYWAWRGSFVASGGRYEIREDRPWTAFRLRIEADGYRAAVSRDIKSDEGTITIDFALERGKNVAGKVVTPGLLPAVGARVALGGSRSWIRFTNGEIDERSNNSPRETTDRAGRFRFPARDKDFQLVITHPSGFTQIKSKPEWDLTRIIRLEPWSRVEGTATDLSFNAAVGRDGTFRIDDVPEGDYLLSVFFLRIQAGFSHNHRFHVPPRAGPEARPVDLGTLTLEKP